MRESTPGTPLPTHGSCFVCGDENPAGMRLAWHERDGGVVSEFSLGIAYQGPPRHVHGGATAAVLDEGMGKAVWLSGMQVVLATMTVDYRKPVTLGTPLRVECVVERVEGRKAYAAGRVVLPDGTVAVEATGLYLHVPAFFEGVPNYVAARRPPHLSG